MTVVELSISLAGLAVVGAMLVTFFVGVTRVDRLHEADDDALLTLRTVREHITRDVREARGFVVAGAAGMTMWHDADWDGVLDDGELVAWKIGDDGVLTRQIDGEDAVVLTRGLESASSSFRFDGASAVDIRTVDILLTAGVATGPPSTDRSLQFEVSLRNMP